MHINNVDESIYTIFDENHEEYDKQSAIEEYKQKIADGYEYGEDFSFLLCEVSYPDIKFDITDYIIKHIEIIDDTLGELDPPGKYFSEIKDLEKYIDNKELIKQVLKNEYDLNTDELNQKINEKFFDSESFKTFIIHGVIDFDGIE